MVTTTRTIRDALLPTGYVTFESLFDITQYPAGERHVYLCAGVEPGSVRTVEATVHNFDDLGLLVTADRILRRLGHTVEWFVPYFPFARHDRRVDPLDGLELEVALEQVRDVRIVIADPHSEMTAQLRHFPQAEVVRLFEKMGLFDEDPIVVVPDAGAAKKAHSWAGNRTVVQALKTRDVHTGRLSGFQVLADDLGGRPCIIVDDICDGGGTFLGLAEELRNANAGPLTLAVTHGLFTKGTSRLRDEFDTIACLTPTEPHPCRELNGRGVQTIPFADLYTQGAIT